MMNGTVTMEVALKALDIGWGNEVIVPALTFAATAYAPMAAGALPVIVDVTPATWCIDPDLVEAAITPRTRAIMPVHLGHQMADMDRIMEIESVSFGANDAYPRDQFEELLHEHPDGFFVSDRGDRVVGYVVGYVGGTLGHVDSLAVEPTARSAGVGRVLMERLLDHLAASVRVCSLEVRPENESAIRFYESLGFHVVGQELAYYDDGGDAVVMHRAP
jgi:ribosomal-protein-alanine acetyltransferase